MEFVLQRKTGRYRFKLKKLKISINQQAPAHHSPPEGPGGLSEGWWSKRPQSQDGNTGTSLVAQWLRHHAPRAGVLGSIPGQGT